MIREREARVVGAQWQPDITFLLQTNPLDIWQRLLTATNRTAHGFNESDMWKKLFKEISFTKK